MPPLKQPVKLFDAALTTVNKCIVESCQNIEKTYGKYSELRCQETVQEIQDYLLSCLPYNLLETMCNKIHLTLTEFNSVDSRIISSVFIHKNCQKFNPKFELVPDNEFWISKICMLEKIVVLNLKMVCTDDVLQVVGAKCRSLEYINIVSKISSLYNSTSNFNALKLKFFVSDAGLKFLSECKNLKKIEMTRIVRSQCAGSKITHSGICLLLKSLPKLEVISYSDLGYVIDKIDNVDTLSLSSISDYHPVPQRILKISSLCPHLTELCLHLPTDFSISKNVSDDILIHLSKSSLRLERLELIHFFLNDSFQEFIKEKGKHLISLCLSKHASVSGVIDAVMLGYHCPNIENLHLASVGISQVNLNMIESVKKKIIYKNLKCLSIYSRDIDFNNVLPVFLGNAKNIMNIAVDNFGPSVFIDKTLQGIMNCNQLNELQKAHFYRGLFLSFDFLVKFTLFCPKLKHLTIQDCSLLTEKNVEDFKGDLKIKNYDINITLLQIRVSFIND